MFYFHYYKIVFTVKFYHALYTFFVRMHTYIALTHAICRVSLTLLGSMECNGMNNKIYAYFCYR